MTAVVHWIFGAPGDIPLGAALGWRPGLVALHVATDLSAAASFIAIPAALLWFTRKRQDLLVQHRTLAWWFGALLFSAAATHVIGLLTIWFAIFGLHALAKGATAVAAIGTVAVLWPQLPELVRLPTSQQLADVNRRLRREVAAHEATLRELEGAHRDLEHRVEERTKELSLVKARFETALRGAQVYLFSQDRDLRQTWTYSPRGDHALPAPDNEAVLAVKERVLERGTPDDIEASFSMPEGRVRFALHVDPTFGPDGEIDGIMCGAIDVTRIRSLESEQQRLTAELATTLQRYETALRGSNVTVFTQEGPELRYTSISNAAFGREVNEIVGRTDEDVLPAESRGPVVAMKREVFERGAPSDSEVRIGAGTGPRWFDLHIEPLRDVAGTTIGITCAAVDITERKEGEAHLRLLMRELTHRSKNLLAVIQAMARQTARRAGNIESFLDYFSARLQALARSHDLLVQEGWHGAALEELVRSQLGHYLDRSSPQVKIQGPSVVLRPEAAQSLGLALHELATNAAKYGALSAPAGHISITWALPGAEKAGLELVWVEQGGPAVSAPDHRGFGTLAIERNLAQSLEGEVEMAFAPEGLRCRIVIPADQLHAH
jgi:PAS domain S-box-containing protein